MKKIIIILTLITTILSLNKQESYEIPKDSIRFRVIASSNSKKDQELKKQVIKNLTKKISTIEKAKTITESRKIINRELPAFKTIVNDTLKNEKNRDFQINYGYNYFPKKKYQGVSYSKGNYESLVITIGKGTGDNFWCVLFPPLCFTEEKPKEYKSFLKEIINKYF